MVFFCRGSLWSPREGTPTVRCQFEGVCVGRGRWRSLAEVPAQLRSGFSFLEFKKASLGLCFLQALCGGAIFIQIRPHQRGKHQSLRRELSVPVRSTCLHHCRIWTFFSKGAFGD